MSETIIVALITGGLALVGTLAGSYFSNRRSAALIAYRLERLKALVEAGKMTAEEYQQLTGETYNDDV